MIKIIQQKGSGKEVDRIEEQEFQGETVQHTIREWVDNPTDYTSFTEDSITINGETFTFPQGNDIEFQSPHEQIIDPRRDENGVLHAMVIKRYSREHKNIFEAEDCDCSFNPPRDNTEQKVFEATIYIEPEAMKITKELREIEIEIKSIEDEALKGIIQDRINGSI